MTVQGTVLCFHCQFNRHAEVHHRLRPLLKPMGEQAEQSG
jgi:hypothetical protein